MKNKVDEAVKSTRCAALRQAVSESRKNIVSEYAEKETVFSVLVETEKDGYAYGHTENFIEVKIKTDDMPSGMLGKIVSVKLNKKQNYADLSVIEAYKI